MQCVKHPINYTYGPSVTATPSFCYYRTGSFAQASYLSPARPLPGCPFGQAASASGTYFKLPPWWNKSSANSNYCSCQHSDRHPTDLSVILSCPSSLPQVAHSPAQSTPPSPINPSVSYCSRHQASRCPIISSQFWTLPNYHLASKKMSH